MSPLGATTHNASLSSAVTLTVPAQADWILISVQTQNVRVTLDGTTPTASLGLVLVADQDPIALPVVSGGTVKVIEEAASAAIDYNFWAD